MIESVERATCDGCGKTVEREAELREPSGDPNEREEVPEGWVHVEVWVGDAYGPSREGDFHSKQCAARWLLKRERKTRPTATYEPAEPAEEVNVAE